jgi:AcrR family transcriptional regulator
MCIQSTSPQRLLSRDERRDAILRGAAAAFSRAGYAATSMDDVAVASGITRLIVYRHFESKAELYRSVLGQVGGRMRELFDEGRRRGERHDLAVRTFLSVARENPGGFTLLWRHASREPEFAGFASDARRAVVAVVLERLAGRTGDRVLERWVAEVMASYLVEGVLAWMDEGSPARDAEFLAFATRGLEALYTAWIGRANH